MDFEFDEAKEATNLERHGLSLAFAVRIFQDADHLILPTIREADEEELYKVIGEVDGKLYTAIHVWRSSRIRFISVRRTMPVKKERIAAIEPDPRDPEDRAAGADEVARGLMGRHIRKLRTRLGLSQTEFANRYGIPVANIRQYEIGRIMPPPAVRAYLGVIAQEPEMAADALRRSQAA